MTTGRKDRDECVVGKAGNRLRVPWSHLVCVSQEPRLRKRVSCWWRRA